MALRETSVEVNVLGNVEPLKRINELMDTIMKNANKMGEILDKAMGGVSGSASSATSAMNNFKSGTDTARSKVSELNKVVGDNQSKMDNMSRGMDRMTHSMHNMSNDTSTLAERIHHNMGDLMMAGTTLTGAGYGIGKAVGYTVKSAADFNQSMANAKSVMDPSDVKKYSGALQNLAIQQGIKTKYSASEAADAIGELAKAGVSTSQIMHGALAGSLNLATAGDLGLKDSAEIASTALNTFHDKGMTVAKAANILSGAANASATDVGELKYSLSMSATVADGLGASLKGTSTALAVMAQNGLKGSDAGTSLKTMMMRLHPQTRAQWAMFEQLGLTTTDTSKAMQVLRDHGVKPLANDSGTLMRQMEQLAAKITNSKEGSVKATKEFTALSQGTGAVHSAFFNANGQVKSFAGIAQLLKTHLHGLNGEQRSAALETMFGSDAIRGSNILYKEGAKGVNDMATAMSKIKAADVARQKMNTFKGTIEQLRGSLETMGITFGNIILPVLGLFIKGLTGAANFLTKLPGPLKAVLIVLASFAAALLLATGATIALGLGATALKTSLMVLAPNFVASATAAGGFGAALSAALWPIVLIVAGIAAVAAAAYLIIKNWKPISAFFKNLFGGVIDAVSQAANRIKGIWHGVTSIFSGNVGKGVSILDGLLPTNQITGIVSGAAAIKPAFTMLKGAGDSLRGSFAKLKTIIQGTLEIFQGDTGIGVSMLAGILPYSTIRKIISGTGMIKGAFNSMKRTVNTVFLTITGSIIRGWNYIAPTIVSGLRTVQKWWRSIWPQLSTVLKVVIGAIIKVIGVTLIPAFMAIRIALSALRASWRNIWHSIADVFKLTWDVIKTAVKISWHLISGIITVGLDVLTGKWGKAWKDLKKMTMNLWGDLKTGFKDIMGDLLSLAVDGMKAVANGLLAGLATGINGVSKGINWILGKVDAPKKLRIPYWTPPKFAKGTDGAPGGPSILGDGGKHEMFRTPQGHVGLSPATSTLYNLPAGTQILSGEKTAQLLGSLPHFANGAGSWISNAAGTIVNGAKTVGSKIKNAAVDVWSYMSDPSKLMDLVADKFSITKGLSDFPSGIVEGMFNKVKSGIGNFFSSMVGSFSGAGGSKAVNAWVQQALKISGAPSSWASALETIAMKESGGNPRAVNGWDSNAKAGHPSMGLMQTIQSTFNAHAKKGYSSILNPVDNIIAAIGYIKSRYGSVFNVPGIKSMAAGGAYKGYANGGVANTPQVASLAENSWPEYIISTQPSMRKRSLGLFNRLGQALGVSQSPDAANAQAQSSSYTPETSRTTVNRSSRSMEYHPEIHVTVKGDGDTTSNVKKAVKEALDDHYKELTGLYDPGVSY